MQSAPPEDRRTPLNKVFRKGTVFKADMDEKQEFTDGRADVTADERE